MTQYAHLHTPEQAATIARMTSAPAMQWKVTGTFKLKFLSNGKVAVRISARDKSGKLFWGMVLPNGNFVKPRPGRTTIDASDISVHL